MKSLDKYKGIIPAFYACYDGEGNISPERVRALTEYFIRKGVKGIYVNGSSGECIYQSVEDRKVVLENVMEAAAGKLTVIVSTPNRFALQTISSFSPWKSSRYFLTQQGGRTTTINML